MDTQQLLSLLQKSISQNNELMALHAKMLEFMMKGQINFVPPPVPTGPYGRKKSVRSHTDPSVFYTVTTYPDGRKTCTCPHFKYRKIPCKHM